VTVKDRNQLVVVDVAEPFIEVDFTQESAVRHQLTEPDIRRESPDFG
jgi:hypothetical protein